MGKTIGEWRIQQAKGFHDNKKLFVKVLKQRIAWHTQAMAETDDSAEQEAHLDMLERDEVTIENIKEEYKTRRRILKTHTIEIPDLEA